MVLDIIEAFDALSEECKALYPGRRKGAYDDQARMWDKLGAKSSEKYVPRHAAEVPA